jgi:hypothetical protein
MPLFSNGGTYKRPTSQASLTVTLVILRGEVVSSRLISEAKCYGDLLALELRSGVVGTHYRQMQRAARGTLTQ